MKVPFPISIGVVGAPGSGKQALADAFTQLADPWFQENDSELWIVENSGRTIGQDFDHPLGMIGTCGDDLRCFFRRLEAEQLAAAKGVSYFSCGTAIENIAHCGTNLETVVTGFATPDQERLVQERQLTMATLSMLLRGSFRYTFGFYLPRPEKVILPDTDEVEENYEVRVANGVMQVLAGFRLPIQVLDEPTIEEKAETMFSTIKRIMEEGPDVPEVESIEELEEVADAGG